MGIPDEELQERIKAQFTRNPRSFVATTFLGALTAFRGNMQTGNLDLTISVGPNEKDKALAMTDAPGVLLLIEVTRISPKEVKRGRSKGSADK